jgi:hypothetical protein
LVRVIVRARRVMMEGNSAFMLAPKGEGEGDDEGCPAKGVNTSGNDASSMAVTAKMTEKGLEI